MFDKVCDSGPIAKGNNEIAITKKKVLFFLFNKIDLIDEGKKFKTKIEKYLSNNYSQYQMINTDFISAKKNIRIKNFIKQIINSY